MSVRFDCAEVAPRSRGIAQAVQAIQAGELVVMPTDTVYGVGCDAFDRSAVRALQTAKGREPSSTSAVMVAHVRTLDGIATGVSPQLRALVEGFWPGALTVICRSQQTLNWSLGSTLAVRMPLHAVALEVLERTGPLAVTGANAAGRPIPLTCADAQEQLGEAVRVYLDAGPSSAAVPSTVVDGTGERPRVVRLGALTVEELREVVPDLLGPGEEDSE